MRSLSDSLRLTMVSCTVARKDHHGDYDECTTNIVSQTTIMPPVAQSGSQEARTVMVIDRLALTNATKARLPESGGLSSRETPNKKGSCSLDMFDSFSTITLPDYMLLTTIEVFFKTFGVQSWLVQTVLPVISMRVPQSAAQRLCTTC